MKRAAGKLYTDEQWQDIMRGIRLDNLKEFIDKNPLTPSVISNKIKFREGTEYIKKLRKHISFDDIYAFTQQYCND